MGPYSLQNKTSSFVWLKFFSLASLPAFHKLSPAIVNLAEQLDSVFLSPQSSSNIETLDYPDFWQLLHHQHFSLLLHITFPSPPKLCIFSVSLLLGNFSPDTHILVDTGILNSFPLVIYLYWNCCVLPFLCFAIFILDFGSTSSRAKINKPFLGGARWK